MTHAEPFFLFVGFPGPHDPWDVPQPAVDRYAGVDVTMPATTRRPDRILEGRRWSEGLHQAVEAKERVGIREENQTLATITLQNYFRMYDKLAGMPGRR